MTEAPIRISFFGAGPAAMPWVSALAKEASLSSSPLSPAAAVILGPGAQEPFGLARDALRAGRPVLWACGHLPDPWRLATLDRLSVPGGPFLRFYEPFQYQGGFGLLKRFLRGPEPFWRPLYLRTLSGLSPRPGRLDDAAIEALAACQALLTSEPEQVTASAARQENGEPCALFLNVRYRHGPVVQCTASATETAGELVVVTPGRTLTLDGSRDGACLRIAPSGQDAIGPQRERVLMAPNGDPVVEEARRFISAVNHGTPSTGNRDRWLRVAALWWAARQSISAGSPVWLPPPPFAETETPPFKLIEGGDRAAHMATSRRLLTLVAS